MDMEEEFDVIVRYHSRNWLDELKMLNQAKCWNIGHVQYYAIPQIMAFCQINRTPYILNTWDRFICGKAHFSSFNLLLICQLNDLQMCLMQRDSTDIVRQISAFAFCRIYPFLNYTQPWAPLAYVGLFVVHWAFFGVVIALNQLKIRYISGRDSLVNKRVLNKLQ